MDGQEDFKYNASDISAILELPIAFPPPGITSNFHNPKWYGQQCVIAGGVALPVLTLFLVVRTYVKVFMTRKITMDDYIYWISWPAGVVYITMSMALMTSAGYGYHAWDVQLKDFTGDHGVVRTLAILQGPLLWLMKLTLFSLIFNAFHALRWTKVLVYIGVVASFLVFIPNGVISGYYCEDITDPADVALGKGPSGRALECANPAGIVGQHNLVLGAFNVLIDFYILLVPLPGIYALSMPRSRKIGVYVIFLAGLGACVCSLMALRYRVRQFHSEDITYNLVSLTTVNIIEVCVGLMIPCAASVAQLYNCLRDRWFPSRRPRRVKISKSDPGFWKYTYPDQIDEIVQLKDAGELLSRRGSGGNNWTWYSRTRLGSIGSQNDMIVPMSPLSPLSPTFPLQDEEMAPLNRPEPMHRKWNERAMLESFGSRAFREDMRG